MESSGVASAPAAAESDSASFWAKLLAEERKRIQEQEEAKANM